MTEISTMHTHRWIRGSISRRRRRATRTRTRTCVPPRRDAFPEHVVFVSRSARDRAFSTLVPSQPSARASVAAPGRSIDTCADPCGLVIIVQPLTTRSRTRGERDEACRGHAAWHVVRSEMSLSRPCWLSTLGAVAGGRAGDEPFGAGPALRRCERCLSMTRMPRNTRTKIQHRPAHSMTAGWLNLIRTNGFFLR
ncbi:hypothetical protein BV25DRAFT_1191727 [Artomyces pyxidatus]|uniref:Uncharacterized protein n=1 Tax=Artomyces pyxidatus TaxID=48021 RepID=A0ACB8SR58_9AGAM|nr:hypothetical protein BV25DRAFT_1191727 [Artomyces pyxidatus]